MMTSWRLWGITRFFSMLCLVSMMGMMPVMADEGTGEEAAAPVPKLIDIDVYFKTHRSRPGEGRIIMTDPLPVTFDAKIMRHPQTNKTDYLQMALGFSSWDPMPVVKHSMFVASKTGKVVPVYMEEGVARYVSELTKVGDHKKFEGFHIYSYAKGPAILVLGVK